MKIKSSFLVLVFSLAFSVYTQAQWVEVTDTYIKNAAYSDAVNSWKNIGVGGWDTPVTGPKTLQAYFHEATGNFSFTQKIGLPAGCYKLFVNGVFRYGAGNTYQNISQAYLKAGSQTKLLNYLFQNNPASVPGDIPAASTAFQQGYYPNEIVFTLNNNAEVEIGIYGELPVYYSWCAFGPFHLYRNDFQYKIDVCQSVLEHSTGDKTAFSAAINTAKGVDQTNVEVATAATTALESARQTYVLAATPEDGYPFDFTFKVANNQFNNGTDGWSGNCFLSGLSVNPCCEYYNCDFAVWQTPNGLPTGQYVIKVQGFYRYGADAFGVGPDNRTFLHANNGAKRKPLVSIVTGAMDENQYKCTEAGSEWKTDAYRDGKHVPFSGNGASIYFLKGRYENELPFYVSNGSLEIAIKNIEAESTHLQYDWTCIDNVRLEYLGAKTPANMKVSATADWGTFVAPFDVTIPKNIRAFKVSYSGGNTVDTEILGTIPANTPVLLKNEGTEDFDQTFYGTPNTANVTEFKTENLVGTTDVIAVPTTKDTGSVYLLQYKDSQIGWYKVTKYNLQLIANRAYLVVPSTSEVRDFIPMGDVTGIAAFTTSEHQKSDDTSYTLSGQKVTPGYKGIVVRNNKKYFVK